MTDLKLYLFGPPRILRGETWIEIGLRKSVALLAYLVTTKHSQSRETLAAFFWPQSDQVTALANLRRAIYRVNHALQQDILVANRTIVRVNPEVRLWLDIDVFQENLQGCQKATPPEASTGPVCFENLSRAVALYTNDFLAGFTLPDSREFDEWQYFQAESFKRMLDGALEQLITACREREDWQQAISFSRQRLALNPFEDAAHYQIIELYALNDQHVLALRQYEEYYAMLERELGVSPDERVVELVELIRSKQFFLTRGETRFPDEPVGLPPASGVGFSRTVDVPAVAYQLPEQSRPFIGRKKEMEEIHDLLAENPASRLVTITGLSGIGKTRLAVEAAAKASHAFLDGMAFISLDSLNSAGNLGLHIVSQIKNFAHEGSDHKQGLLHFLQDKAMLLILDGFEHLLPAPELLAEILASAPKAKLLVTSTERLNLKSETVYLLEGMDYPAGTSIADDIFSYDAVQLFLQYAHLTRPQIEARPEEYRHIARICHLVAGLPIAIILATGWINVLSYQEIAAEITKNIDFLKSQLCDLPERQLSLRAVFEYSWNRLSAREREAFMRLSVVREGFTREAASQVADADLLTLRALIDKSFISLKENGRYEIHGLLRHYGDELLVLSGQVDHTRSLHSQYYLEFLNQRTSTLKGHGQQAALAEIEAELQNIRAAWAWALQSKNVQGIDHALESWFLFSDIRGRQEEGALRLKAAYDALAPEPGDKPSLAYGRILLRLGMLQSRYLRHYPPLRDLIQKGLAIVREFESEPDIAFGLLALAHYTSDTQLDGESAFQLYQQSFQLFSKIGEDYFAARAVHLMGHCQLFTTGIKNFIPYGEQSLEISRRIGDVANVALLLISLAMVEFFLGRYDASWRYAQEALDIASKVGHRPAWAQTHNFLAILSLLQGDLKQAGRHAKEGYKIAREVNFPVPIIYAKATQAVLACLEGRTADGLAHAKAGEAYEADPYARLFAHWSSAVAHCSSGEDESAQREVEKIYELDSRLQAPGIAALTLPVLAILQARKGCPERAVELMALAHNQPMCPSGWLERWILLKEIQAELERKFCAADYQAVWKRGEALDINLVLPDMQTPV